jgi:hypothetical protein
MKLRILLAVFVLIVFPVIADAALIYEQATLETTDRGAYQYFGQQLADDFVPIVTADLQTITWRGSYYGADNPASTESFTIQLFTDNGGLPPATPFFEVVGSASKVASGTLLGKTLYDYSMSVAGPVLNTGTTYWINIYTNDSPANYAWANSTNGTPEGALRSGVGAWSDLDNDVRSNHVFALNGGAAAVPTMNEWGMIIFAVLAGVGSVYYLKKYVRA